MNASLFDAELKQRVSLCLIAATHAGVRKLTVEACDETVILTGTVRTFYEKQLAQEIVRHLASVLYVINAVQVTPETAISPSHHDSS